MTQTAPDISNSHKPVEESPTLLDDAKTLWLEFRGLVYDRMQLLALETEQAGKSLVSMIINSIIVALLVVSAWLGLLSAVVLWLIHLGIMATLAILLSVVVNLVVAGILYQSIRRQSRNLGWPATLRSLRPEPFPAKETNDGTS